MLESSQQLSFQYENVRTYVTAKKAWLQVTQADHITPVITPQSMWART